MRNSPYLDSPLRSEAQARADAAAVAKHWQDLADSQRAMAAWEESRGRPHGSTAPYHYRAATYDQAAEALRREAATGAPHCTNCLGAHANHHCRGVRS